MLQRVCASRNLVRRTHQSLFFRSASSESTTMSSADIMKYLSTPPYTLPNNKKVVAPNMVYISGEEMTHYTMQLM
jgi:hypothetical protein